MKLLTTKDQFAAIELKFCEIRSEVSSYALPAGAGPTGSDLWAMATSLVIAENT